MPSGDTWVGLSRDIIPVQEAQAWATQPSCGAVVTFSGIVRDHAPGRPDVSELEYEAYEEEVEPRLRAVADDARRQFDAVGRIAVLHRIGRLRVSDVAVVVVVSAAHRDAAFDAARYCIDTVKATVPIWKKETWAGGSEWGQDAQPIHTVDGARTAVRP
jgi:molybdopterin synthase catalytic subunit